MVRSSPRPRALGRRALSLLAALAVLGPGVGGAPLRPARAGDEPADAATARAAAHFRYAEEAEERGDHATAIREYLEAYAAKPHPAVLFNIGRCHEEIEDLAGAAAYLQLYLDTSPRAEDREDVARRVAALRRRAGRSATRPGSGRLEVSGAPGTTVVLDGRPLGSVPFGLDVPAGPHHVRFESAGGRHERLVDVEPGGTVEVRAPGPAPEPPGVPSGAEGPADPDPGDAGTARSAGPWLLSVFNNLDLTEARYGVGLGFGLGGDRLQVELDLHYGAYYALGLTGRMYLTTRGARPYLAASLLAGSLIDAGASFYGIDSAVGVAWRPRREASSRVRIDYYLSAALRVLFVEESEATSAASGAVGFDVPLGFGMIMRY